MAKGQPGSVLQQRLKGVGKIGSYWDNELCAEHDGTVPSFSRINRKIANLARYTDLRVQEKTNLAKVGYVAGGVAVGVIAVAGVAASSGAAGPAIASSLGKMGLLGAAGTGTAISTLNGAALTSASLAAIGMGSATTGVAVVSAVGLGLGGAAGGAVGYKYLKDDPSFSVSLLKRSQEDPVVFINGFLQEKESTFHDWKQGHVECFPDERLYGVTWASKELTDLGNALMGAAGPQAAKSMLAAAAMMAKKNAHKVMGPHALLATISQVIGNPWHLAMASASKTGAMLADAIARSKETDFTLVGHSLGCRVIYYALEALSTRQDVSVRDVILLGGAVGRNDKAGWRRASKAVSGGIYNCFSSQDSVLRYLYRFGNLGISDPIGLNPISYKGSKITNIDCSEFVDSHMTWKKCYPDILEIIYS